MAEIINLKPTYYDVSPGLAGFLTVGVVVILVTVAVFVWTLCRRRYGQMCGAYKLQSGSCDSPVDPPYKFIHMLKGISIYPETLSTKKIVRMGRLADTSRDRGSGSEGGLVRQSGRGVGGGRVLMVDTESARLSCPSRVKQSHAHRPADQARFERPVPDLPTHCCSSGEQSRSCVVNATSIFPPCQSDHVDSPPASLGTLNLGVDYNFPKKALVVTIVKAQGLPSVDGQASDPYVKMTILPEKKHRVKTRVLRKTLEPVFDETFTFYGVAYSSLPELTLHFLVLSFDRFARDDVIGEVAVPMAGVDPSTGRVNITQQIRKRHIQCVSRGELLVSLSYQPVTQRLNVIVLKAKHLPKMDISGLSGNPYVKVNVYYGHKRIAKKKTQVKKCTPNPTFDKSFDFDLPAELLGDISVEFLVVDFDRTTKNEVVGRLVLGGQSLMPTGVTHWREVCDHPRQQIAKWHDLAKY
ncbi:synaptotagmin-11a [Aplochiton taeniatus]